MLLSLCVMICDTHLCRLVASTTFYGGGAMELISWVCWFLELIMIAYKRFKCLFIF